MKGKTTESPTIILHRYCQGFNSCVLFLLLKCIYVLLVVCMYTPCLHGAQVGQK